MSQAASRIYTGLGDDGTTGRLNGGRLSKDDALVEACGDVDETVSALGMAREALAGDPATTQLVLDLQRHLFAVAADLMASPRARDRLTDGVSRVVPEMTELVERAIDRHVEEAPLRPVFVVPGGSRASAVLDLARTICRRAERHVVRARNAGSEVSDDVLVYLNRLSDLLYVLARRTSGPDEEPASHE
ncbi:MAG TPA: cob(I)yrinic acid a,c-diamide adenosyltransferase [Actinomycetales bacterium]|nr:cob(I)yrinic acid a,c-diamide adenosyltransferase [Actinomycetales bacterium]